MQQQNRRPLPCMPHPDPGMVHLQFLDDDVLEQRSIMQVWA